MGILICGLNGAGKSTLMNILTGVIPADEGTITFLGKQYPSPTIQQMEAAGIAFVHQELNVINDLSVSDNIFLCREIKTKLGLIDQKEQLKRTRQLFEDLGVDMNPSAMVSELKTSEKQLLEICRALYADAQLLILDEPTSGLDPLVQQTFYEILREENSRGTTILFSSHVLSEVQKLCDRVCILREGRLIAIQSMKELRENGYKKISLSTEEPVPAQFFDIPGIANLEQNQNSISFMFNGNVMTIMEKLHKLPLVDILIEEPSLEEIFLHYYE